MDGIKPLGELLGSNCGIVKLEDIIVFVGVIEIVGCVLDSDDKVEWIN